MPDWSDECTHLICAFANTPKWAQVAAIGGKIVTRDWIDACKQAGAQIAWRNFKCGKYRDKVCNDAVMILIFSKSSIKLTPKENCIKM